MFFLIIHIFSKLIFIYSQTFGQFNPGIIVVGFCFSMNSDVSWLLRKCQYKSNSVNISDVQILPLKQLCEELNINYDPYHPRDTINNVISSLLTVKTHDIKIFYCDEVLPCWEEGQTIPDWRDVITPENCQWILSLRPVGPSEETINLTPPSHSSVVERKLIHGHRNAYLIRSAGISSLYFSHYFIITNCLTPSSFLTIASLASSL